MLDTNILISAVWKPGGNEDRVVELVLAGELEAVATPELLAEYEEVLGRAKFRKLADKIAPLMEALARVLRIVEGNERLTLASDPDDNLVLEAALAGGAEYLITGNLRDYPLEWKVARIVNARHFLEETGRYSKV